MNVELHIEELVLDGHAEQRDRVATALRDELERLCREDGLTPSLSTSADLVRADMPAASGPAETPARLGVGIAQAVYGSVSRGR